MVESSLVYKKIIDGASFGYARCRILFDADGVPVDGVYLEVNAAFAHAVRRSPREIVGRSISELVSESGFQLNDMLEMMDRAIKTGEAQEFESHLKAVNHWYKVYVVAPQPGIVVTVWFDITEQKRTQAELAYKVKRQRLMSGVSQILITVDLKSADEKLNAALEMLGKFYSADRCYLYEYEEDGNVCRNSHEWCEEGVASVKEEMQREELDQFPWWASMMNLGQPIQVDDVLSIPDEGIAERNILLGQQIKSLVVFPVQKDDRIIGFWGMDFTRFHIRMNEEELMFLSIASKLIAAVLIRAQTEKELVQARELAIRASLAKSSFLASMSHEIRTPLSGVIGFAELLATTQLTDEQSRYVESAIASAHALLGIVNDVLDFSKIEVGKMDLEEVPTDLRDLVHQTVEMVKYSAVKKGLKFTTIIAPAAPERVKVDPLRLKQVLINLLSNAIKFTERGSVTLRIEYAKTGPDHQGQLLFKIRDTGIGISESQQGKLFKSFSQADASTTRKYGGTGLGLVIAQSLVNKMGSSIGFKSELGKGSEFYFALNRSAVIEADPSRVGEDDDHHVYGHHITHDGVQELADLSPKIMIVEDVYLNMMLVKAMIGKILPSATCIFAENGRKAVELFGSSAPDVIFMDIQMPELDGYEATQEIRVIEAAKHMVPTPIIALTAGAIVGEREKCLHAGMDDYISKPVDREELARKLVEHLGSTSVEQ